MNYEITTFSKSYLFRITNYMLFVCVIKGTEPFDVHMKCLCLKLLHGTAYMKTSNLVVKSALWDPLL